MKQPSSTPTQPISEFVPVTGGPEQTNENVMLIAAYMAFWLLVFAFIATTWRTQRRLGTRLDRLEKNLTESGPPAQDR